VRTCLEPTRTIAFLIACEECELADYQALAADIKDRTVHHVIVIVEHSEIGYLSYEPIYILHRVFVAHTQEDEKSPSDMAFHDAVDGYAGLANSLNNCTHF
jgi:hypothetical protein